MAEDIPPIPSNWTSIEQHVWKEILAGHAVFLAPMSGTPTQERQWTDHPKLSGEFLTKILSDPLLRRQIPRAGVHISGAFITGVFIISNVEVSGNVDLANCRFEKVIFYQARFDQDLSLEFSRFDDFVAGEIQFQSGKLFDIYSEKEIHFGVLNAPGGLFVGRCETPALDLSGSHFGKLTVDGSPTDGSPTDHLKVIFEYGIVDEDVVMYHVSQLRIDGTRARNIGIHHLNDQSSAKGLVVGNDIFLNEEIEGILDLSFSTIGRDLNLSQAYLNQGLDLSGVTVGNAIILTDGKNNVAWGPKANLILKDTTAKVLRDRSSAWPRSLQIDGFSFKKWRAEDWEGKAEEFDHRNINWFLDWLRREHAYSPEPYRQLASAFRDAGMDDKATTILFNSKQRERHTLAGFPKIFSTLALVFTGYGYHYEYSIYWSSGFVLLGTMIFAFSNEGKICRLNRVHVGYGDLFFYSLDAFLPFVHLRNKFADVDFNGWIKYYFYLHRLAGYVIGSFVVAALAGLTK